MCDLTGNTKAHTKVADWCGNPEFPLEIVPVGISMVNSSVYSGKRTGCRTLHIVMSLSPTLGH